MTGSTATDAVPTPSAATTGLRVLFDVDRSAEVHLFRNAIRELDDRGCETFVTAREQGATTDLLDAYGIDHVSLSTRGDSMPGVVLELLTREVRLLSPGTLRRLAEMLSGHGQVAISTENELTSDLAPHELRIRPADVHHVPSHADLVVGDSGTMSAAAAMLGTPSIRTNATIGDDENVLRELEDRYGLLRSYADEGRAFRAVERTLAYGIDRVDWHERRDRLLADQPDVTGRLVETVLESTPNGDPSG